MTLERCPSRIRPQRPPSASQMSEHVQFGQLQCGLHTALPARSFIRLLTRGTVGGEEGMGGIRQAQAHLRNTARMTLAPTLRRAFHSSATCKSSSCLHLTALQPYFPVARAELHLAPRPRRATIRHYYGGRGFNTIVCQCGSPGRIHSTTARHGCGKGDIQARCS